MGMKKEEIESMIKNSIPDATIEIKDLAGDDNHYSATVVSKMFENKSKVVQHKMVYDALEGKMGGILHALSLTTLTPKN
jgi:stress-induced morphogen